jgi:carbamoyl-phosphate synthase large subunit
VNEGRPNIADLVKSREIQLIINTPLGKTSFYDERAIRRAAMQYSVPCITTLTGAKATAEAIRALKEEKLEVRSLQDYHAQAASK